ncbi:MAG: L-threonine 3-dehydrogenase [Chloroflexi bacterium]|nr:L-threonine 3-dehydrogenase [Chloroflexota bacterium]
MTDKTISAVKIAPKQTEIREFDLPLIPEDAGLLKVTAAGVCGSDVGGYARALPENAANIMGHENVGYIERIGAVAAEQWGLKPGDRVALEEYLPCLRCDWCSVGEYRLCARADRLALGMIRYGTTPITKSPALWGGFGHFMYLHPNSVFHRLPESIPDEYAVAALPMGNGVQWAKIEGGVGPGKSILIQGPGQQGIGCVIASKEAGAARIIVAGLTRDRRRLEVARHCGADEVIDVQTEDLRTRVDLLTEGRGVDIVVDVTGGSANTVLAGIDVLKNKGGTLVIQGGEFDHFSFEQVTRKYITIKSCRGHSYAAVEEAIATIASGKYPFNEVCSHRFGLSGVDTAIRATAGEGITDAIHVSVFPWED